MDLASYRSIKGVLTALKDYLALAMAAGVDGAGAPISVILLGSETLGSKPSSNSLGIYLHRVAIDPYGRNRYFSPQGSSQVRQPELPVNLHILLVGWCKDADAEIGLIGWAMQQIGVGMELDIAHVGVADQRWNPRDAVQIIPEEMSTEDLMRIWDSLPGDYRLSSPYIIKTLRLEQDADSRSGPPVKTVVVPMEGVGAA